jgi:hypothetical protein
MRPRPYQSRVLHIRKTAMSFFLLFSPYDEYKAGKRSRIFTFFFLFLKGRKRQ